MYWGGGKKIVFYLNLCRHKVNFEMIFEIPSQNFKWVKDFQRKIIKMQY